MKKNQTLLSISVSDLDFILENHLSSAFLILAKYNAKVNLVQNSAVSCSFALDIDDLKISRIQVDEGRTMKRWRARARGRAAKILKRSSHLTVGLDLMEV